ncbi:MAG: hypothetical protein KF816_08625 [Melioribacteraceae bacterium]|jgi:Tol biopolymer transport system component|nr:hypothetical protein [Melioribacteraceae bacterium]
MKLLNIRIPRIFLAIIFISIFITGCNPLIIIESGKNSAVQDFYFDNYKLQGRVTLLSEENEYLLSFSLFDKNDIKPLEGTKSYLDIIRYGPRRHRYTREKFPYLNGLEVIFNKITNEYECKYKFTSKSKYELTIRISEIAGKALEEELLISFDQDTK